MRTKIYEKISADSFLDTIIDTIAIESIAFPPIAKGQTAKSYLLEDLRCFLCAAISLKLDKYEKSSNPIRDEALSQALILYYHILGYSDEDARKKIISVLDRKEVWDGE